MNTLPYELFSEFTKGYFNNEWPTIAALNKRNSLCAEDWFYMIFSCSVGDCDVQINIAGNIKGAFDGGDIYADTKARYIITVSGTDCITREYKLPELIRKKVSEFMIPDEDDEEHEASRDEDGNHTEYNYYLDEENPVADLKRVLGILDKSFKEAAGM